MHITMLYTRRGAHGHGAVSVFEEGESYEVEDSLGRYFIRQRWAHEVGNTHPILTPIESPFSFRFDSAKPRVPTNPATLLAMDKLKD